MYTFRKCSEVDDTITFKAFTDGFVDYMIQVKMDEEFFINRFFGIEGNDRELSYVALKDDVPVGVCLGGIKTNEKIKTLRCGGMSVIPEHRGTGVAKSLMKLHEKAARKINCKQLFLEVLKGNDRAISFYKKLGYEKVYDLEYRKWSMDNVSSLKIDVALSEKVKEITYDEVRKIKQFDYTHIPWQSCFDFFKDIDCHYYGIYEDGVIVAGCVATNNRLFYLYVHDDHRLKGYAKALLNSAITDLKPKVLALMHANNSSMCTFANHLNMEKDKISQYEMYRWL
ncbi:GNAT family N-acetyltransferase [Clostridiaceae bacterium M8S5]|nr:GNAT family N-acetyltransferase [Clostridiaceae bacterium M8S5]